MKLADLITPERTSTDVEATSKKRALEVLSALLAGSIPSMSGDEVFSGLIDRERLGSTGIGHGVAIPHGRMRHADTALAAFIRLHQPVEFDSIDNQPVDLVIGLLVPEHYTDEHLAILANLAELFGDDLFCERIRAAQSDEEIFYLLTQDPQTGQARTA
jgi:PTS system nitrogen regulatory IIA component